MCSSASRNYSGIYAMEQRKKFFATVLCYITILGIKPLPSTALKSFVQNHQLLINKVHISCMFLSLVYYGYSVFGFVIFKAVTFIEYAEAAFYCVAVMLHLASYAIMIWVRDKLFTLVEDSERVIDESVFESKQFAKKEFQKYDC